MKITVLYGGEGPEREVSLKSGAAVTAAFAERGLEVTSVDLIRKEDLPAIIKQESIEFAFITLHGGWGEDGTLQAALGMSRTPFSGSGHSACALAMDKTASKALFGMKGIPTPEGIEVVRGTGVREVMGDPRFSLLLERSGKLVVKPCCSGSTVGVSILDGADQLSEALEDAFAINSRALVEEYIPGRELTVTISERDGVPRCLPVIEIQPVAGFYDYSSKYTPGMSELLIPAPLSNDIAGAVGRASINAYTALGCSSFGRVDLRLDEEGRPYVLEVNTVPGMTANSLVPKAAVAAGMSFGELLEEIVRSSLAINRGDQ